MTATPIAVEGVELLRRMILIRRFEERCAQLYQQSQIHGFLHLYIGEEAVAVGVMDALDLTNAQSGEEVRTKRFSANEITIMKRGGIEQKVVDKEVTLGDFVFPVREDE